MDNDNNGDSSPVDSLFQANDAIKLRRSQQAEEEVATESVERVSNEVPKMGMEGTQNTTTGSILDAKGATERMKNSQPLANEDAASQDFSIRTRGSTATSILEAKAAIRMRRSGGMTTTSENNNQDGNTTSQQGCRNDGEEAQDQDVPEEPEKVNEKGENSESGRFLVAAELVNVEQAEVIDLNSLVAASNQPKNILLVSLLLLVIVLITVGGICGSGLCSPKEAVKEGREEKQHVGCIGGNGVPLSNCTCHESCASCGYYHNPVNDADCVTCQEGLDLTPVFLDGAGLCGRSDSEDFPCLVPWYKTFDCFDSCSSCTGGRDATSFLNQNCGSLEEDLLEVMSCCPVCANATEALLQCLDAKPNQTICDL